MATKNGACRARIPSDSSRGPLGVGPRVSRANIHPHPTRNRTRSTRPPRAQGAGARSHSFMCPTLDTALASHHLQLYVAVASNTIVAARMTNPNRFPAHVPRRGPSLPVIRVWRCRLLLARGPPPYTPARRHRPRRLDTRHAWPARPHSLNPLPPRPVVCVRCPPMAGRGRGRPRDAARTGRRSGRRF